MATIKHQVHDDMVLEELGKPLVTLDETMSQYVVLDNIPVVDASKYDKLVLFMSKKLKDYNEKSLVVPRDENGATQGLAIIEFADDVAAKRAVTALNGWALDKKHVTRANIFEDFMKLRDYPDEFVPSKTAEVEQGENPWGWLSDPEVRDQFAIKYGPDTEVLFCSNGRTATKPESVEKRVNWSEDFTWSTHGTYFVSYHEPGVRVWVGENWVELHRLKHINVRLAYFSPSESYLVTVSMDGSIVLTSADGNEVREKQILIILWDVRSGQQLGEFRAPFSMLQTVVDEEPEKIIDDPPRHPLLFSHDEKYFSIVDKGRQIRLYVTATVSLLHGKEYAFPGVADAIWSPSANMLACWVPEASAAPARVLLLECPSMAVLKSLNLFSVARCHLYWNWDGKRLAVRVDRSGKKRKKAVVATQMSFFNLHDKAMPVETLDLAESDRVFAFAWEPQGHLFALIHGSQKQRHDVSLYSMRTVEVVETMPTTGGSMSMKKKSKKGKKKIDTVQVEVDKLRHLLTLDKRQAQTLAWSPAGGVLLLAGLYPEMASQLEWIDTNRLVSMRTDEHLFVTNVEWDPTGRFVATYVCHRKQQLDNGYRLWTNQGRRLHTATKEKFFRLMWRPRPPSPLSAEEIASLKANFKTYRDRYYREDMALKSEEREAYSLQRQALRDAFVEVRRKNWGKFEREQGENEKDDGTVAVSQWALVEYTH